MSFFNEFLKEIKFDRINDNVICSIEFGKSAMIFGSFKIISMAENEIVFSVKKRLFLVQGNALKIKSMAAGEMLVSGNVLGVIEKC